MSVDIGSAFKLGENNNTGIKGATGYNSIGEFVSTIIPNVLIVANIILFVIIVMAGFTVITSAGNPDKQKEASQTLTFAVLGFIIIFAAYWIMGILKIITGFDFLGGAGV